MRKSSVYSVVAASVLIVNSAFGAEVVSQNIVGFVRRPMEVFSRTCKYQGKDYVSSVSQELLLGSPAWPDAEQNPPLPLRNALSASQAVLIHFPLEGRSWSLQSITLHRCSIGKEVRWLYEVTYFASEGGAQGIPEQSQVRLPKAVEELPILVLTNGKTVSPELRQWNWPKPQAEPDATDADQTKTPNKAPEATR